MPALAPEIIKDLSQRLAAYLQQKGIECEPLFLNAGGSAAVFKIEVDGKPRAVKAFDPVLFQGPGAEAERRRLDVQRRLINHSCPNLIQTYTVDEAQGTAFMQMEFIDWPQLKDVIKAVPDESIVPLISQLVDSVKFLEHQGIVHRDIKPENIHVSHDFLRLKLLDLGVARELTTAPEVDGGVTDKPGRRPFLATAQYSSPEYLFRLDEPTEKLWSALNIYQIGAVLHDLIMKRSLFHEEMQLENRWLVAKAVLTKMPSFKDSFPSRLSNLKALASRCLTKDMELRLQLVSWEDFAFQNVADSMIALQERLNTRGCLPSEVRERSAAERLNFERTDFINRFIERLRAEFAAACTTKLPFELVAQQGKYNYRLNFSASGGARIFIDLGFEWLQEILARHVKISISAAVATQDTAGELVRKPVVTCAINEAEDEAFNSLCNSIASLLGRGLDLVDCQAVSESNKYIDLQN